MPNRPPRRWRVAPLGGAPGGTPLATLPQATTLPASSITDTSAVLNGSVTPNGLATSYLFAWGTTTAYGNTTPLIAIGNGDIPITVQATITGLTQGTFYHFAVVAKNSAGTVFGFDVGFTAEPPSTVPTLAGLPSAYSTTPPQPHFAWPFTIQPLGAVVNQQDSLADVFSCVIAIEACPAGACSELPTFGRPDSTFATTNPTTGLPLDGVIEAIQNQEPRADEQAVAAAVNAAETGQWVLALTTLVQSTDGQLS